MTTKMKKKKKSEDPLEMYEMSTILSIRMIRPVDAGNVCYLMCQVCGDDMLMGAHIELTALQTTDEDGELLDEPQEIVESVVMCRSCYKKFERAVTHLADNILKDVAFEGML